MRRDREAVQGRRATPAGDAGGACRRTPAAQASQDERHEHEQQRHDAGEEIALGAHERLQARSPEAQLLVGGEPGVGVGAVLHDGHHRPWRLPERAQLRVGIEKGRGQPDADTRADEGPEPRATIAQSPAERHLRQDVRRQPQRRIDEEVAVRQVLQRQRHAGHRGVPAGARAATIRAGPRARTGTTARTAPAGVVPG